MPAITTCVDAAIVAEQRTLAGWIVDLLTSRVRVTTHHAEIVTGRLQQKTVACAWPQRGTSLDEHLVSAIIDGHRPRVLLAAGEAVSAGSSSYVAGIRTATGPGNDTIPLAHAVRPSNERAAIDVTALAVEGQQAPVAPWAYTVASTAKGRAVPCIQFALVHPAAGLADAQRSRAYRLGAAVGVLMRGSGSAKHAAKQATRHWRLQEELAKAVTGAVTGWTPPTRSSGDS